ncbi:MAG TPA: hypothetical protein ENK02_09605 [Planctomycetes bacterium]|nr:hypothetical protein [Planctomycetota bacterium]
MKTTLLSLIALSLLLNPLPAQGGRPRKDAPKQETLGDADKKADKKKDAKDSKVKPAPTPKEALELLRKLKKEKLEDLKVEMLEEAGRCDDPGVATKIAAYLKDKRDELRIAAIRALRYMKNKKALPLLLAAAGSFEKDKVAGPEYYMALGQQGDPKAIKTIIHRAWEPIGQELFNAKIKALTHIRSPKTVAELEKLNRKFRRNRYGARRREILNAIEILIDEQAPKGDRNKRLAWIREAPKKEVPIEPSKLPKNRINAYKKLWRRPDEKSQEEKGKGKKRRKKKRRSQA